MSAFRSGFVAVVGRPNVGKSTLVNAMVGTKVTIVSPRPNTTRSQVRGVLTRPDAQVVFVDTPGLHRPKTALGERMNESATSSLDDVDAVVALVEATGAVGPGDRMVLEHSVRRVRAMARAAALAAELGSGGPGAVGRPTLFVVVNKIDRVGGDGVLGHLTAVSSVVGALDAESGGDPVPVEYFPLSAATGDGSAGTGRRPGRPCCPRAPGTTPTGWSPTWPRRSGWPTWCARSCSTGWPTSCPHSIACRVTEWEWPRVRCEILVERDSQKGIVIGKGGEDAQGGGHRRARADGAGCLPRAVRAGGEALAAARGLAGPPRLLTAGPGPPAAGPRRRCPRGRRRPRRGRRRFIGGTRPSSAPR